MKQSLNLLVIDEEQLYAEHLVKLLSAYYEDVNLGFLDEKAELIKILRHEWDVLVFNRAYDMTLTDAVGIIQDHNIALPIIALAKNTQVAELNKFGLPEMIYGDMVKSVPVGQDSMLVMAICLQEQYIKSKRQLQSLRAILKESEQRANILIENSKFAVAYIDQGVHIFANEPYLQLFGYDSIKDIIGVPVVDLIAGGDNVKGFKQFLRKFDKGDRSQVEFEFESKRTDGTTFASKLQLAAATLEGEPVTQMIIQQNQASDAELVKKLAQAERLDPLTGLANRIAFTENLQSTYNELTNGTLKSACLLYIRMDNAPKINSTLGITGLDMAVKQIAYLLDEFFAKTNDVSVARFSDTHFAVILHDVGADDALTMAQSVCQKVASLLIEVGSRTVTTTLSVGMVMMDINTPTPQVVLERAVDTMHELDIDSDAPDKVSVFDISRLASEDDSVLSEYLQNALAHNQLQLSYQAIYDIQTDSSDLFEVYVTLPMADGSSLTFEKIIPIARKNNLLDKLDRWVLVNATKYLIHVRKTHPTAKMLVGLSSSALEDNGFANNFVASITQLIRAIGGDTQALILQFNEQDLLDYMVAAKRQFMALDNIRCRYGVYSFGSTTKYEDVLTHLSPSVVRLARSYTKDLDREVNLNSLQSLIATINTHHASTLMPYIEEASVMSLAWSVGARFLQGDYLQPATSEMVFAPPAQ